MNENWNDIQIEICCGSYEDAVTAIRFPIQRIELNSALALGGLTPDFVTFQKVKEKTNIPLMVMVRPREAGFVYRETEKERMVETADFFLKQGADGIVFGFLSPDFTIEEASTKTMVNLIHSYGKTAVFHRAFDEVKDVKSAIETLIQCKVDRVLTSGLSKTALEGISTIAYLQKNYGDRIEILPGCGINESNIQTILQVSKVTQFHMSAKTSFQDQGEYWQVDGRKIQAVLQKIGKKGVPSSHKQNLPLADLEMLQNDKYED